MDALIANLTRPDNLPILGMLGGLVLVGWVWIREIRANDRVIRDQGHDALRDEMHK